MLAITEIYVQKEEVIQQEGAFHFARMMSEIHKKFLVLMEIFYEEGMYKMKLTAIIIL